MCGGMGIVSATVTLYLRAPVLVFSFVLVALAFSLGGSLPRISCIRKDRRSWCSER